MLKLFCYLLFTYNNTVLGIVLLIELTAQTLLLGTLLSEAPVNKSKKCLFSV